MRIRTIKPEFWRSYDIKGLPMSLRLLFVGLWSYVDDNGVGLDDYLQITADLFALEDDPVAAREFVRDGLARLSRGSLIVRYKIDGKDFIYIPTWDEHQKIDHPSRARYQRPPTDIDHATSQNGEEPDHVARVSRDSRETLAPGTGEQGNRGTGEKNTCARPASATAHDPPAELSLIEPPSSDTVVPIHRKADETFTRFWAAYPRKKSKQKARTAFDKATRSTNPETIITAAGLLAASHPDPKYTPYPATWLNGGCWEDEPDPDPIRHPGYQGYQPPTDHAVYHQGLLPS